MTTAPVPGTAPAGGCPAPAAAPVAASVHLVEVVAELTEAMHAYEYALQYGRPVTEARIRFLQSVEALYRIAKHGHSANTANTANTVRSDRPAPLSKVGSSTEPSTRPGAG